MRSEATDDAEAEQIKEVIRLLNLALASCHKALAEVKHRAPGAARNRPQGATNASIAKFSTHDQAD